MDVLANELADEDHIAEPVCGGYAEVVEADIIEWLDRSANNGALTADVAVAACGDCGKVGRARAE